MNLVYFNTAFPKSNTFSNESSPVIQHFLIYLKCHVTLFNIYLFTIFKNVLYPKTFLWYYNYKQILRYSNERRDKHEISCQRGDSG